MPRPWDGLVPEEDIRALESRGSLVDRAPRWGRHPCLLVVDMTRSFVEPGYPASCWDTGGEAATKATEDVLAPARAAGIPVLFTRVLRGDGGDELFKITKPELLATPEGLPDGNVVADRLGPRPGEIVIAKPKPSAFFGTALDAYLNKLQVDSLIVTGMVTSGCVRATVVDGYMRNHHVTVVEDAVADYSDFQHRTSLLDMHVKYADVVPTAEVVDHLGARIA